MDDVRLNAEDQGHERGKGTKVAEQADAATQSGDPARRNARRFHQILEARLARADVAMRQQRVVAARPQPLVQDRHVPGRTADVQPGDDA